MKFNIGEWVTKPGVKICNCQQVREAKLSPDGRTLSLFCVGYTRDERALDGPALFLTITAPPQGYSGGGGGPLQGLGGEGPPL